MPATDPKPLVAHVDLDAFFASCEQRDNPEYRGKPVVVGALPGGRGVVAAASYEARRFGIRSAMPIGEAYRRCPDAVFLRPQMEKYVTASREVFAVLEDITPNLEKASIDEAYLDISGLEKIFGNPSDIGQRIKQLIFSRTDLTASVGIGPNRLIAKLGSDYRKPDGLTVVEPDNVQRFLDPMPVGNLRGLGPQTQKIFDRLNIRTIAELRNSDPRRLEQALGQRSARGFLQQAAGIASAEIHPQRQRKSISKERTFADDITDRDDLREPLRNLAKSVAYSLRARELSGNLLRLKIRFSGFETHTRQQQLSAPTQDERVIFTVALALLRAADLPAKPVRLIGIGLSDWGKADDRQGDMFATHQQSGKDQQLLQAIDNVNARFGSDKLKIGVDRKPQTSPATKKPLR